MSSYRGVHELWHATSPCRLKLTVIIQSCTIWYTYLLSLGLHFIGVALEAIWLWGPALEGLVELLLDVKYLWEEPPTSTSSTMASLLNPKISGIMSVDSISGHSFKACGFLMAVKERIICVVGFLSESREVRLGWSYGLHCLKVFSCTLAVWWWNGLAGAAIATLGKRGVEVICNGVSGPDNHTHSHEDLPLPSSAFVWRVYVSGYGRTKPVKVEKSLLGMKCISSISSEA